MVVPRAHAADFTELDDDDALRRTIEVRLQSRDDRPVSMPYGRRLGWYALARATRRSAAILGMFATMSILWSFWSAGSVGEWLSVWALLWEKGLFEPRALAMVALVALAVAVPSVPVTV